MKLLGILLLLCTELCLGKNADGELLLHRISDQLKQQIQSAESSVKKEGKTMVFVSHGMNQVKELCDRAVWISEGKIKMDGKTATVAEEYIKETR